MRITRTKAARKTLAFYRVIFKLVPPYQILLDGNFLYHALNVKTSVVQRISKMLGKSEVKLLVPRAVITELEKLGERCKSALEFCSKQCVIIGEAQQTPANAMLKFASTGNYIVATQDEDLRRQLRQLPGVAICHFSGTILTLEPPSRASLKTAIKVERERSKLDEHELHLARRLRRDINVKRENVSVDKDSVLSKARRRKKKKRAAGPNPLSCMKSIKRR
mmetsp:Transcript_12287/g.16579  ORF Transcript_12287/g.16579 Transcript_12287/m.16579 type:complete len:221 (-) Transcript_12287:437-1099(-)